MESTADPYTTQIHSQSELGVRLCQAVFHGLAVIMENGSRAVLEHFLKPRFIIKLTEEINPRLTKYCLFTPYFALYRLTDNESDRWREQLKWRGTAVSHRGVSSDHESRTNGYHV